MLSLSSSAKGLYIPSKYCSSNISISFSDPVHSKWIVVMNVKGEGMENENEGGRQGRREGKEGGEGGGEGGPVPLCSWSCGIGVLTSSNNLRFVNLAKSPDRAHCPFL